MIYEAICQTCDMSDTWYPLGLPRVRRNESEESSMTKSVAAETGLVEAVLEARVRSRLTMEGAANEADLSPMTWSKFENGIPIRSSSIRKIQTWLRSKDGDAAERPKSEGAAARQVPAAEIVTRLEQMDTVTLSLVRDLAAAIATKRQAESKQGD